MGEAQGPERTGGRHAEVKNLHDVVHRDVLRCDGGMHAARARRTAIHTSPTARQTLLSPLIAAIAILVKKLFTVETLSAHTVYVFGLILLAFFFISARIYWVYINDVQLVSFHNFLDDLTPHTTSQMVVLLLLFTADPEVKL